MPKPGAMTFQDPATLGGILMLKVHNYMSNYLFLMLGIVIWSLLSLMKNPYKSLSVLKYKSHGSTLELIWTMTPALMLVLMSIPSFQLLYSMEEMLDPKMTLKAMGSQWYWTYNYNDLTNTPLEFDSYLVPECDLNAGELSLLEVDNRMVLPMGLPMSLLMTSKDVLHAWTIPSLGVKVDAVPGSLNQLTMNILSKGLYFGACSELCGAEHLGMPMVLEGVSLVYYLTWLNGEMN